MAMGNGTIFGLAILAIVLVAVSVQRPRIGLAIILLSFIPAPLFPTPELAKLFYGFAGFTLAVLIGWLTKLSFHAAPFEGYLPADRIGFSLSLWLSLCALGLPLSLAFNQGTLSDRLYFYAKGVAPFLYLLVFFVVRALPFSFREYKRILNYLLVVGVAFAIVTFAIYAVTQARVTWAYAPLQFPFVVLGCNIAFVRALIAESKRAVLGWAVLTIVLAFAALLTFTKALIIVLVLSLTLDAVLAARVAARRSGLRILTFGFAVATFALVVAAFASTEARTTFIDLVSARLNDITSTESRYSEWESALTQFLESPVIGKGVGYQLEREVGADTLTTGYVHNQLAYASMTMGVTGIFAFALMVFSWLSATFCFHNVSPLVASVLIPLHGCVLTLLAYGEMFATFRTIQHNFVLGVLLAMIVRMTPLARVLSPRLEDVTGMRSVANAGL